MLERVCGHALLLLLWLLHDANDSRLGNNQHLSRYGGWEVEVNSGGYPWEIASVMQSEGHGFRQSGHIQQLLGG